MEFSINITNKVTNIIVNIKNYTIKKIKKYIHYNTHIYISYSYIYVTKERFSIDL